MGQRLRVDFPQPARSVGPIAASPRIQSFKHTPFQIRVTVLFIFKTVRGETVVMESDGRGEEGCEGGGMAHLHSRAWRASESWLTLSGPFAVNILISSGVAAVRLLPASSGELMIDQIAKCVRSSSGVRLPLPT